MSNEPRKVYISPASLKKIEKLRNDLVQLLNVNFGPYKREGSEGRYSYRFDKTMTQIADELDLDTSNISRHLRYPDIYDSNQPRKNGFEFTNAKVRIYNQCVEKMRRECKDKLKSSIEGIKHSFSHAQLIQQHEQLQWILEKYSDDIITEFIRDVTYGYDDIAVQRSVLEIKLQIARSQSLQRLEKLNFVLDNDTKLTDTLKDLWPVEDMSKDLLSDEFFSLLEKEETGRKLLLDYLKTKQQGEIIRIAEAILSFARLS